MSILVCGGAGYIGSHTCVELINAGYDIIVVDNFVNSSAQAIERVEKIVGRSITLIKADLCHEDEIDQIFCHYPEISGVIHFAGLKAVGESVHKPLDYYHNNLVSTLVLLRMMRKYGVKNLVFSSSATVYGEPIRIPIDEEVPTGGITNPYGATKLFIEQVLKDLYHADPSTNVALLRYFNPIGAHESGLIGEDPNGIPNNLVPYIAQVAIGKLDKLHVFGNDYPTRDGTGVRDYIHVVDLARGHVAALEKLKTGCGLFICNLGTGKGYSVLDVVHAYEKACGKTIPYEVVSRRAGDIAICYANVEKARQELGWEAQYDIEEMCASSWKWQSMNPDGYKIETVRKNE